MLVSHGKGTSSMEEGRENTVYSPAPHVHFFSVQAIHALTFWSQTHFSNLEDMTTYRKLPAYKQHDIQATYIEVVFYLLMIDGYHQVQKTIMSDDQIIQYNPDYAN